MYRTSVALETLKTCKTTVVLEHSYAAKKKNENMFVWLGEGEWGKVVVLSTTRGHRFGGWFKKCIHGICKYVPHLSLSYVIMKRLIVVLVYILIKLQHCVG